MSQVEFSKELLVEVGIPLRYHEEDISAYIGDKHTLAQVNKYLKNAAKAYSKGMGVCLYGASGSQKTLLLAHMVKNLLAYNFTCRWLIADQLPAIQLGSSGSTLNFRQSVRDPGFLAIDSCEEFSSGFARKSLLQAIRVRIDDRKPFLMATRYAPDELNDRLGDGAKQTIEPYVLMLPCFVDELDSHEQSKKIKSEIFEG